MNVVRTNAYAKLNLTLDVTGTAEGYHLLDTLVTTVDLADRIVVKKRKDALMKVTMHGGPFLPPETNNALKAAELFQETFQTGGADIAVYKNIPVGAGMGGSSADAAGVLQALSRLYEVDDFAAVKALADRLGSDTGYLLTGGLARLTGRGERVETLPLAGTLYFLVLVPREGVSTPLCFRAYDEIGQISSPRTEKAALEFSRGNFREGARYCFNALYEAAATLNGDVRDALIDAKSFSPWGAGMTGSGSACFALFENAEFCEWAKSRYTGNCRALVLKSVQKSE